MFVKLSYVRSIESLFFSLYVEKLFFISKHSKKNFSFVRFSYCLSVFIDFYSITSSKKVNYFH